MRIKNVEKWENELVKALKCNYYVEGRKATGKSELFCDIAYRNKINHYTFINHNEAMNDYICVALYGVYKVTTYDNNKGVFIKITSDCIEFYEDATTHYEYKGSCRYDYSINKISYIMEFTTRLNELLNEAL